MCVCMCVSHYCSKDVCVCVWGVAPARFSEAQTYTPTHTHKLSLTHKYIERLSWKKSYRHARTREIHCDPHTHTYTQTHTFSTSCTYAHPCLCYHPLFVCATTLCLFVLPPSRTHAPTYLYIPILMICMFIHSHLGKCIRISTYVSVSMCVWVCMCVCVCLRARLRWQIWGSWPSHSHTHISVHAYIDDPGICLYIYI